MPERLPQLIVEINRLKGELDALQPMPQEAEDKLWKKLRMEWNYNSNHIEGNTLTYSETEALIYFDRTSGDHTLQEYEEMKAHDMAIAMVKQMAAEHDREITQADIRTLNKVILVRPFWKPTKTRSGHISRSLIQVGEYKSQPNHVKTNTGEIFEYAEPEDTPRLMTELMDWYCTESAALPPITIAAEMHYRFIRIHPFGDGNGRVARLLVNYILMRHGFPPIVVESATKDKYLAALERADAGDVLAFHAFLAERQIAALELALKAARGESLDEPGDALKRLELLKRQLKQVDEEQVIKETLSAEIIVNRVEQNSDLIIQRFNDYLKQFFSLFVDTNVAIALGDPGYSTLEYPFGLTKDLIQIESDTRYVNSPATFCCTLVYQLDRLKHAGLTKVNASISIEMIFEETEYVVYIDAFDTIMRTPTSKLIAKKLLHQNLSSSDIDQIGEIAAKSLIDEIEFRIRENGIL